MTRRSVTAGILALALVVLVVAPAAAGAITVRIKDPTCDRPSFRFRIENSTNTYRKFTVVLYQPGPDLFLRDKVPAHGGIRGVVNPDWSVRDFYAVEVFRSWEWRPWNHDWRVGHWLGGASERLDDCV